MNNIELYCNLRFFEEESSYTEQEKKQIIRNIIQLSKTKTEGTAIEIFEREINKTFDYQGSLGYYVQKSEAVEQEEIFGEVITQTVRY